MTTSPKHLCYGSPFLPSLSVSWLGAGISNFDPAAAPGTPLLLLLLFCTAVKLSRGRLNYVAGFFPKTDFSYTKIF